MNVSIQSFKAGYQLEEIQSYLEAQFEENGIWEQWKEKQNILIKPNLLGAFVPEKAVTTHPIVIEAMIRILMDHGKTISVGDSSGGTVSNQKVWNVTGLTDLAHRYPIKLVNFAEAGIIEVEHNGYHFPISRAFWDADAVVSISKYKTHAMMRYTGAIKNLYGIIPGLKKSELHKQFMEMQQFALMITNLFQAVKHKIGFHILDGIVGMEGEGPSAGHPRDFGLLFTSTNGVALDLAACRMLGFDWRKVPIIWESLQVEGLLPSRIQIPPAWEGYVFSNVKLGLVSFSSSLQKNVPPFIQKYIRTHFDFYPDFTEDCRLCKVCVNSCPVQAITYTKGDKHPLIDHSKCIKCLCCHELCPYRAVYIRKSKLASFLMRS